MDNSYSPDLITLIDEDNQERSFEILDIIEEGDSRYYALVPVYEPGEDLLGDSGEYLILEAIDENGEEILAELEDESLRRRLAVEFEERFEDMFWDE